VQKEVQVLTQKKVHFNSFFDFGRNAYSTLEIELETSFQENIEILVGEVAENGRIKHPTNYCTYIQNILQTSIGHQVIKFKIPEYIPAYACNPFMRCPEGPDGEIAPFRYVEVNRHYGDVTVRRTAWYPDWDDDAADFTCSDPDLKQVWDFCKYSIKAESVFDKYVDGERERMPYEGDAVINQLGHFCNDAHFQIAKNTIDHFFAMGEFTWPTEWRLLTPRLVRDYYFYSGDAESVKRWIPLLEEKLLLEYRNSDGLLDQSVYRKRYTANELRDIVDHPVEEQDHYEMGNVNFVPNSYLYDALKAMFDITGDNKYLEIASEFKASVRKHLMHNGLFVDSIGSTHTAQHTAMFALLYGFCDSQEEIDRHRAIVLSKDMACSVYGAQFLLEACFAGNMSDHGIKLMTSKGQRSWFNMINSGATTAMESWGDEFKDNQDWTHAWGAAPANIVTRCLCGIRPLAAGFKRFAVDPRPGSLSSFYVRQPTIHGAIELDWQPDCVTLTVPENTEAVYQDRILPPGKHTL